MTNVALLSLALSLHWEVQVSNTTASLRGLHAVSDRVVWASGTGGTFLTTTDGGGHWRVGVVPGAEALDFRDVEAFDDRTAYLLSSGTGTLSRVYQTTDGGAHWELLLTNPDEKGFFDSIAFWDRSHAILVGDPVNGHFVVMTSADAGKTWQRHETPPALEGEGAFAASGTSVVVDGLKTAWFATGGPGGARVFRSSDRGQHWTVATTPMGATKSAGIFSLAFRGSKYGVAVGGDYSKADATERTLALTHDGGKTWRAPRGATGQFSYRSGGAVIGRHSLIVVGTAGSNISTDNGRIWKSLSGGFALNAVAASGDAVWAVGPKGVIVKLAGELPH
jgi:photosystem II stability/assembly factor-like uncharacterized protein